MPKRMLIDSTHPEETRVVVVNNGSRLDEFDFETSTKRQIKGNIYLAKVTRVEPSLQAAFVDYGGNRHGFLAFSEIHPDYYRIPVGDRRHFEQEHEGEAERRHSRRARRQPDEGGADTFHAEAEPPETALQESSHEESGQEEATSPPPADAAFAAAPAGDWAAGAPVPAFPDEALPSPATGLDDGTAPRA